ncbi:MAG: hypothetical protein LBE31_03325 [Deltaproteobacteria bacterium]|jgi:hypothetical protein|nr:hypothetical protein [Deltaproteobacteria bacterium]
MKTITKIILPALIAAASAIFFSGCYFPMEGFGHALWGIGYQHHDRYQPRPREYRDNRTVIIENNYHIEPDNSPPKRHPGPTKVVTPSRPAPKQPVKIVKPNSRDRVNRDNYQKSDYRKDFDRPNNRPNHPPIRPNQATRPDRKHTAPAANHQPNTPTPKDNNATKQKPSFTPQRPKLNQVKITVPTQKTETSQPAPAQKVEIPNRRLSPKNMFKK